MNPRIILASVSGFGQTGPYRTRAGFDQIAQGMGGLMAITGHPGEGPMRAGIAVADSAAGVYAATGILVALASARNPARASGCRPRCSQAMIAMCDFQAAVYTVEGKVPPQNGNDHPHSTPMGVLPTADGYINVGVGGEGQWKSFCTAIGRDDLADHPDYAEAKLRFRNRPALMGLLGDLFRTQSTAHWLDRLESEGCRPGRSTPWTRSSPIRRSSISAWPCRSTTMPAATSASSPSPGHVAHALGHRDARRRARRTYRRGAGRGRLLPDEIAGLRASRVV